MTLAKTNIAAKPLMTKKRTVGNVDYEQLANGGSNPLRDGGAAHRSGITAADKLATPSVPTSLTDVTTGGSLLAATTYYLAASAFNRWGTTPACAPQSKAMASDASNTHVYQATLAQVTGADGYDIFMSTSSTATAWVARITEAQRAAGCTVTAVGTVTGTSPGAGKININVIGTGLGINVNPFLVNNAYRPSTVTPIDCSGYQRAHIHVQLAVTDLRSLPTLSIVPFFVDQVSVNDYFQGGIQAVPVLTDLGQSLEQDFQLDVDGASGLVVLVDAITGQGAACNVWVELA